MPPMAGKASLGRKNRTAISCDRCRRRKTKCNNPVPGPCDYCHSIGVECHIDETKRRQRPFYFVSEEEFRNLQEIVRYYQPGTELTPEALRSIASNCKKATHDFPDSSASLSPDQLPDLIDNQTPDYTEGNPHNDHLLHQSNSVSGSDAEITIIQDAFQLNQKLGCLLADSQGQYRYMGAESGVSFNTLIRGFKVQGAHTSRAQDVIPGMVIVGMPIPAPILIEKYAPLPSQVICRRLAMRYFEEVHSLYWLYSSERFYDQLEQTYRASWHDLSSSWRCFLYSILAIAALGSPASEDLREITILPIHYLEQAKTFVSGVCDEGSLDSVRAMVALATAMQSHGFSNQAYLYTGLAVQIACSLGLHCDKYCASYGGVEKEQARRVWWSLVVFDQDLSLRLGKPFATKEYWGPPLPSEVILPSGAYSPPEYLAACKELSLLVSITQKCLYKDPFVLHHEIEINSLLEILASLTEWSDNLPPHLRLLVPAAPLHRRPISLLHLRYHSSRLLIARPFLLYQLLSQGNGQETPKSSSLDTFSAICLTSAEQMLAILQSMVNDGIHSRLIALDFYYALDILHIFLASFTLTADQTQFDNIYRCLKILQVMGTTGFGERMLPEVLFELIEWGIFPYQLDHRDDGHMEVQQNLQNCLQDLDESLSNGDAPSEIHDCFFNGQKITSRQKPSGVFSLDVPLDLPSEEVMGEILCPSVE